jgi:CubicO group peptidase (beta-lactamase class C family)
MAKDVLPGLAATLQRSVDAGHVAGMVTLVWQDGEIIHEAAVGYSNIASARAMRRDTLFRIASMTKPLTSLAALLLVEEGRLRLEDPIVEWLPELAQPMVLRTSDGPVTDVVAATREITVDDLLTHRSGLGAFFTTQGPISLAYTQALRSPLSVPMTPDEWLNALATLPLVWQPGDRFQYGVSTDALGLLIARIEGKSLGEILRQRIAGPLGMNDTQFWVPPEERKRIAHLYREDSVDGSLNDLTPQLPPVPSHFESGSGGLLATVDDYLAFARMLLGGGATDGVRIARPETIALLSANRLTEAQRSLPTFGLPNFWSGQGFGLGLSTVLDRASAPPGSGEPGSLGWSGAFGTWWTVDPRRNLIALYMSQDFIALNFDTIRGVFREGRAARAPQFAFARAVDALE